MSALPSIGRADHAVLGADAARVLYERHRSRIFAFCLSRLGNREEAEDAAQTTFLNAFRSLNGGLVPQFELAWLFRIAENVCRDWHKSTSRRRRIEGTRELQDVQDVVSAPARNDDGLMGLQAALADMPERQRRAILLREWQGLSYAEIATELGLSKGAVETLIFRARRTLARGLEAPPLRRRATAGLDVLSLLGLVKSAFQGGAVATVAASAAAVGGAALLVGVPLSDAPRPAPTPVLRAPAPATDVQAPTAARTPTVRPGQTSRPANVSPSAAERASSLVGRAPAHGSDAVSRGSVPGGPATPPTPAPPPDQAPKASAPAAGAQAPAASTPAPEATTPPSVAPDLPTTPPLPPVPASPLPVEPPAVPPLPPVELPGVPPLPPLPALP